MAPQFTALSHYGCSAISFYMKSPRALEIAGLFSSAFSIDIFYLGPLSSPRVIVGVADSRGSTSEA